MGTRDPRVDEYIAHAAPFAQPILTHIRAVVHESCPEVEETVKWSFPHFMYHGILCSMAAFKAHCAMGFWKAGSIVQSVVPTSDDAMGSFGQLRSVKDLPSRRELKQVLHLIMERNMERNAARESAPAPEKPARAAKRAARPELPVPEDLTAALRRHAAARAAFEGFPPSHRREYIEWITEAKRPETRQRRIETALGWLAEGKGRNWKYER